MKHLKSVLYISVIFLLSCSPDENEPNSAFENNRPHSPWIFRSVLDENPRIITLALSDDIWAAYHTEKAALYKIWGGTVAFEGAVYDHKHGPQPMSIGNAYFINAHHAPWTLVSDSGQKFSLVPDYKGHKIVDNEGVLMYHLNHPTLTTPIQVEEMVLATTSKTGQPIFTRKFTTNNVPNGYQLHMLTNVNSIAVEENVKTNGTFTILDKEEVSIGKNRSAVKLNADLVLNQNETTELEIILLYTPLVDNSNKMDEELKPEGGAVHDGLKLIAKADCKTCHNKTLKTIGPSYTAIAAKYSNSDANVAMLVNKVKMGGTGVWGKQVMTPHPEVSESDIKQMIDYIFTLKPNNESEEEKGGNIVGTFKGIDEKSMDFLPGLMTKVYQYDSKIDKMPDPGNKKPVYAGVLRNLDNVRDNDFKELTDQFMMHFDGYLYIENPGIYELRSWSDDGSIVYLGDKKIIDNDGGHSITMKNARVELSKGYHPLKIEYFNGVGGKFMSFNWIKPEDDYAEVVPAFNLFHSKQQEEEMVGYVLPMSIVNKVPGNGEPVEGVHPSFNLYQARPDDFQKKIGGMDFMSDGSLIVCVWDEEGGVYKLENVESTDPSKITATKIAYGLAEPLGLAIVNDEIYVMQKQEMTKLIDNDKDGIIDEYQTLCDDWGVSANFHEFGFGLAHKEGKLYAALATGIQPGGASVKDQVKDRGKVIEVDVVTGELKYLASGLRTPNGVGVGYGGDIYIADNQGDWLPASKILHVTEGAWFGSRSVDYEGTAGLTEKLPVVWLPQDEIGNSPSTPISINVGPYTDQMIHGEVTNGGVKRVFVEEVNGQYQGAVFRFIQGLEAGVNRLTWGPDGALYAGGIGNPGNWQHSGTQWFGLQRLEYNDKTTFEMLALRAKSNGIEIEFTEPLAEGAGWNPSIYEIKQWYYKPTEEYGGPKLDEKRIPVQSVNLSDDRKKVFLELKGIKKNHVVYLRIADAFYSENDNSLWSREAWYTMNQIPKNNNGIVNPNSFIQKNNSLTQTEKSQGWELLFDGKSLDNFRNYNKTSIGSSWIIDDEAIHLNTIVKDGKSYAEDGGDIMTKEIYEDYELKVDWKINNCGNSGIIFNVVESDEYHSVWQTGPEMQVLDNVCHPDTRFVTHRAGDLYDMIETKYVTVNPAGEWNHARIKSKDGQVDFYLNGYNVVSFKMGDENWKEMIANSKFKDMKGFGMSDKGHIALQDHSDKVWFRNIKIRKL